MDTPLTERLGIEAPIIGAPFGPWPQVELAAAISEAGGLGSLGTALRPLPDLREQWRRLRELTGKPFAINHTTRPFDEESFAATLAFGPAAISFHMGVDAELVARAHDAGCLWLQQVMDVGQAEESLAAGADVLIAQGAEAGGNSGFVSTMVLVPQVADVAGDVPVAAAGGIADGRGLAAALALGAHGVCLGTRFLASEEMAIHADWKARIVAADATDAVKVPNDKLVMPGFNRPSWHAVPRALRTELIDRLGAEPDAVDPRATGQELVAALLAGRGDEHLPFTGQSVGLVHEILPAGEIVRRIVADATAVLAGGAPSG